jgi:hypothetical protein
MTIDFDQLQAVARGLTLRFPDGDDPFQMMTRLFEEIAASIEQAYQRLRREGFITDRQSSWLKRDPLDAPG